MINLAGKEDCDRYITEELKRARIEAVQGPRTGGEVPATVTGRLGEFTFTRAWYYWVAKGPMPIAVARSLHADPIGKPDVRVGGHCGCPSPDEYGAEYFTESGAQIYVDPDGKEEETIQRFIGRGLISGEAADKAHFVASKEERANAAVRVIVSSYHIDSDAGLRLFADAVRALGEPSDPARGRGD